MQTPSEIDLKIRLDFYRICTNADVDSYADIPWRFRKVMEMLDRRAMRSVVIRHHLANKASGCATIAVKYGLTSSAVRQIKHNLRRRTEEA